MIRHVERDADVLIEIIVSSADGVVIQACMAGLDGGGIYSLAPVQVITATISAVSLGGSTIILRNSAEGSGGGAFAFGAEAVITIGIGARFVVTGNNAVMNGGGVALSGGASLVVAAGGCSETICSASLRQNGVCNPECMTLGCNWYVFCRDENFHQN